ncbi:MAG: hypothetical protein M3O98_02070 [Actinomycetota bacterium]|nr:hypothetical protein [Actinomycetota bacterium]
MVRRRADVLVFIGGGVVVGASTLAATASLTDAETGVFRWVNELPQSARPFIWPLMQYGTFVTIPVLAAIALVSGRYRFAIAMAISGIGVYLLARVWSSRRISRSAGRCWHSSSQGWSLWAGCTWALTSRSIWSADSPSAWSQEPPPT